VDADVKEASVGGALLESTGEEAVVNDEAAAGGRIAPQESTGEEAMINNEETVLDVAAAYSVSAALESIAPLESTGENRPWLMTRRQLVEVSVHLTIPGRRP